MENPTAPLRWMVTGPETSRLLAKFKSQYHSEETLESSNHEEDTPFQNIFKDDLNSLCSTITSKGNPFMEEGDELMTLDTHRCIENPIGLEPLS